MQRRQEQSVDDAVRAFLSESGLETPLLQFRLVQSWPKVVGETFAPLSQALEVRDEALWVAVTSPSALAELQMQRSSLVQRLNAGVGASIIREIKLVMRNEV